MQKVTGYFPADSALLFLNGNSSILLYTGRRFWNKIKHMGRLRPCVGRRHGTEARREGQEKGKEGGKQRDRCRDDGGSFGTVSRIRRRTFGVCEEI